MFFLTKQLIRLTLPQQHFSINLPSKLRLYCGELLPGALHWVCYNLSGWITTFYIWTQWAKFFDFSLLVWRHRKPKHPNVNICSRRFGDVGCTLYSGRGQRKFWLSTKGEGTLLKCLNRIETTNSSFYLQLNCSVTFTNYIFSF